MRWKHNAFLYERTILGHQKQVAGQSFNRRLSNHGLGGIEQAVQMGYKIAHFGIVHGRLRLCLPGTLSRSVIGEDPNNIKLGQITKFGAGEIFQLTSEYEVEKLFISVCAHAHLSKVL